MQLDLSNVKGVVSGHQNTLLKGQKETLIAQTPMSMEKPKCLLRGPVNILEVRLNSMILFEGDLGVTEIEILLPPLNPGWQVAIDLTARMDCVVQLILQEVERTERDKELVPPPTDSATNILCENCKKARYEIGDACPVCGSLGT